MCAATKNCEKFTKNPILGVYGRSRSSMLINFKSPSPVLVMLNTTRSKERKQVNEQFARHMISYIRLWYSLSYTAGQIITHHGLAVASCRSEVVHHYSAVLKLNCIHSLKFIFLKLTYWPFNLTTYNWAAQHTRDVRLINTITESQVCAGYSTVYTDK